MTRTLVTSVYLLLTTGLVVVFALWAALPIAVAWGVATAIVRGGVA